MECHGEDTGLARFHWTRSSFSNMEMGVDGRDGIVKEEKRKLNLKFLSVIKDQAATQGTFGISNS